MKPISILAGTLCLIAGCAEEEPTQQTNPTVPAVEEPSYSESALLFDFGDNAENNWYAVNDTVMGGVSEGTVDYTDSAMVFEGYVSTDNNGGFTSVRSPSSTEDLREFDRVVIRLRNEGQPFTMVLANNPYWFQGQFRLDIETEGEDWQIVEVPLGDFEMYSFATGYPEPTGEMMRKPDRKEILHMEFMSKLFEDGPFRLEVDYLAFD